MARKTSKVKPLPDLRTWWQARPRCTFAELPSAIHLVNIAAWAGMFALLGDPLWQATQELVSPLHGPNSTWGAVLATAVLLTVGVYLLLGAVYSRASFKVLTDRMVAAAPAGRT